MAITNFKKTKEYLVCIDSDGCVMDTMNVKHFECFGPKIVEEWDLHAYRKEILTIWNKQNLFSKTRGINRFQGLSLLFSTITELGIEIEGREVLAQWCKTTPSLSNQALQEEIDRTGNICLKKALSWSYKVNEAIAALPKTDCVFPYAKETLAHLHTYADIAIVSSANQEAIQEEWGRLGCMQYVTILCGQEAGTKAYCIQELKQYYPLSHVMMIGDALSDLKAAKDNGVSFYPILAAKEADSWKQLNDEVADKFFANEITKEDVDAWEQQMNENLA